MTPAKKGARKATKKAPAKKAAKKAPAKKKSGAASKAKAAAKHSTRLHKAGVIDEGAITEEFRKRLGKLKPEEVKALIAARKKLGATGKLGGAGADFF
jgi:hypothetical protein